MYLVRSEDPPHCQQSDQERRKAPFLRSERTWPLDEGSTSRGAPAGSSVCSVDEQSAESLGITWIL